MHNQTSQCLVAIIGLTLCKPKDHSKYIKQNLNMQNKNAILVINLYYQHLVAIIGMTLCKH